MTVRHGAEKTRLSLRVTEAQLQTRVRTT